MQQAEKRTLSTVLSIVLILLLLVPSFLSIIPLNGQVLIRAAEGSPAPDNDNRLNIIVIMTDDQRWDTVQYMGNVSELAEQGITFNNSFVTTALCCPSRSTFLTGQYAHNHHILHNEPPFGGATLFGDSSTLAVWLQNSGYATALIGKYLNGYSDMSPYIPPGWNEWRVFVSPDYFDYELNENSQIVSYGHSAADYSTDVIRDKAIDFIATSERPFFLWLTPFAPHGSTIPAPRHAGTCNGIPIDKLPSFNEADVSDKPPWIANIPPFSNQRVSSIEQDNRAQICTLKAVDDAVGAILNALGPDIDNTVIIYTTDNGFLWGEHRMEHKNQVYEEAIRVPLIVYSPNPDLLSSSIPITIDELVANIDLAPTIAELASVTPQTQVDGMSLLPLINNQSTGWRDKFFIEQTREEGSTRVNATGVRTDQYKYVQYLNHVTNSVIAREFYDLLEDPYELENSINNPEYAQIIDELSQYIVQPGTEEPPPDSEPGAMLTINAIAGVPWGKDVTVSGLLEHVTEGSSVTDPVANALVTFDGTGAFNLPEVTTNVDGTFLASGKAPDNVDTGWTVQAHFAGDSSNQAAESEIRTYSTSKHESNISLTAAKTSVPWGQATSFIATLEDITSGGIPISGKIIHFDGNGLIGSQVDQSTDVNGKAIFNGNAPNTVNTGWKYQAHFAGDSLYIMKDSAVKSYSTTKHVVSLTLTAPSSIPWGQPTKFTAILKDTSNGGTPISGKTIHYDGTGVSGVSDVTTDTSGKAIGTGTAPSTVNTGWKNQAHFAGDSLYQKKDTSMNSYSTIKHTTTLTLTVSPTSVSPDGTYKVEGFLKDSTKGGTPLSSMTITFSAESPITIPNKTTTAAGKFSATGLPAPDSSGIYDIRAHFTANTLYQAKDSVLKTLTVQ